MLRTSSSYEINLPDRFPIMSAFELIFHSSLVRQSIVADHFPISVAHLSSFSVAADKLGCAVPRRLSRRLALFHLEKLLYLLEFSSCSHYFSCQSTVFGGKEK
jgi:hypothetical protein